MALADEAASGDAVPHTGAHARRTVLRPVQAARCRGVAAVTALGILAPVPVLHRVPVPALEYPKVFVVGCPRSGTTWVADILGSHPAVIGGRESHVYARLWKPIVEGGARSLSTWMRVFYAFERDRALGRPVGPWHYVDRRTLAGLGRAILAEASTDHEVARRLVRGMLDIHFARSGGTTGQVLVEKTPLHVLYLEQILSDFPDAHVVEVVRDGRDVCVSMQMRSARVPDVPSDRAMQIEVWAQCVRAGLAVRAQPNLRDRVTVVRYEDLKADTVGEIGRLFAACGLDASEELTTEAAASTDLARFGRGAGAFRFRGESGTWLDHFTPEDARLFRSVAGEVFEAAGYRY